MDIVIDRMCEDVPTGTMLTLMVPTFGDQRWAKPTLSVPIDRVCCENDG